MAPPGESAAQGGRLARALRDKTRVDPAIGTRRAVGDRGTLNARTVGVIPLPIGRLVGPTEADRRPRGVGALVHHAGEPVEPAA